MALRKKIKSQSKNRVLIVQNSESEGPGLLELVLKKNRITYKTVDLGRDAEIPNFSDYSAVIVLGGPDSANDRAEKILGELKKTKEAIDAGIPFLGICLGMHDHGLDAQLTAGTLDAESDLSAVGDQDFFKHVF